MSAESTLHLQCGRCKLHIAINEESLAHAAENVGGSDDDFCCPLCKHNQMILFVETDAED